MTEAADADDRPRSSRAAGRAARASPRGTASAPASASGAAADGVEIADRHRQPGRRQHEVLREPAVAADAAAGAAPQVAPLAQVLLAEAAARAAPASPGSVDEHGLADVDAVRAVAELLDRADDLVARA